MAFTLDDADRIAAVLRSVAGADQATVAAGLTPVIEELVVARDAALGSGTVPGTDRPLSRGWLQTETGLGAQAAGRAVRFGRMYTEFPALADAVSCGSINTGHVEALRRLLFVRSTPYRETVAREAFDRLLACAQANTVREFETKCKEFRDVVNESDPDVGPTSDRVDVTFRDNHDGTTTITATLETLDAMVFRSVLQETVRGLMKADHKARDAAEERSTPDPAGDPFDADPTPPSQDAAEAELQAEQAAAEQALRQFVFGDAYPALRRPNAALRRVDALRLMIRNALTRPKDLPLPDAVAVNLTMDWETFNHTAAERQNPDATESLDPVRVLTDPGYRARTIDGHPIPRSQLFLAAVFARVRRVVFDSASRKMDLGRSSRAFSDAARLAVLTKYGGCSQCGEPIGFTDLDHLIEWTDNGQSDGVNADPKCKTCHRDKTAIEHTKRQTRRAA